MSSVFSRKITMSTFSGCLTGDGTPLYQRTGRRQINRSSSWRSATFSDRIPPPTGVVNGPLMPTKYSRNASTVSSGSQLLNCLKLFSPAYPSIHAICFFPPYAFATAASNTRTLARQMSGPVPSPSMNGMIGLSGTLSRPLCREMEVPVVGGVSEVKFGIFFLGQVTCRPQKFSADAVENSVEKASRLHRCDEESE